MAEYKLTQEIIARSVADNWDQAKLEWTLDTIWFSERPQTCLCGHFPIIEICVIANERNGEKAEVGNCCVKKFLGLPSDRIFQAIKRIQKDQTKALNEDAILYVHDKKLISDWERKFYLDTYAKRRLSPKQHAMRLRINQKILHLFSLARHGS